MPGVRSSLNIASCSTLVNVVVVACSEFESSSSKRSCGLGHR